MDRVISMLGKVKESMSRIDMLLLEVSNSRLNFFFDESTIEVTVDEPEACFLRLVAWIYTIFHEGDSCTNILLAFEKGEKYGVDPQMALEFKELSHAIRTALSHNLDRKSARDMSFRYLFGDWTKTQIGLEVPLSREHWEHCCISILDQFSLILDKIKRSLNCIQQDVELRSLIVEDWENVITKTVKIYKYHSVCRKVFFELGIVYDEVRFTKIHYEIWISELKNIGRVNFQDVAERQVTDACIVFIQKGRFLLPITGADLITLLNVSPGPMVGKLLKDAKDYYSSNPCTKEALIDYLRNSL